MPCKVYVSDVVSIIHVLLIKILCSFLTSPCSSLRNPKSIYRYIPLSIKFLTR
jgi:hypothetical protein